MYKYQAENKKGYVVISTVLILLFVTLGISATLSFLSIGSAKVSQSFGSGQQALFFSDACLEESLLQLRLNPAYSGGIVNITDGQCHIDVANTSGIYTIRVYFSGQEKYQNSIEAHVENVNGGLYIISWEEKPFVIK